MSVQFVFAIICVSFVQLAAATVYKDCGKQLRMFILYNANNNNNYNENIDIKFSGGHDASPNNLQQLRSMSKDWNVKPMQKHGQ